MKLFKKGSYVVYKRDVCKIIDISKNKYTNLDSYILEPLFDKSLKVSVPVESKNNFLRELLTRKEIKKLIGDIPNIKPAESSNLTLESLYKELFHSGKIEDLIKIIKTTYLRNEERQRAKRSIGQKDKEYFEKAEKYLYNEISVVLNMSFEDAKKYVIDRVSESAREK